LLLVILLPIAASEPWKEGSRSWPGRRGSEPWNRGKPWDLGDSGSGGPLATKVIHMKGIDSQRSVTVQEGRVGLVYRNVSSVHAEFHYVYRVKLGIKEKSFIFTARTSSCEPVNTFQIRIHLKLYDCGQKSATTRPPNHCGSLSGSTKGHSTGMFPTRLRD
jgi:hypothetical protein